MPKDLHAKPKRRPRKHNKDTHRAQHKLMITGQTYTTTPKDIPAHQRPYLLHLFVHQGPVYKCLGHLVSALVPRDSTYSDHDRPSTLNKEHVKKGNTGDELIATIYTQVRCASDPTYKQYLSKSQVERMVAVPQTIANRHRGCHVIGQSRARSTWH